MPHAQAWEACYRTFETWGEHDTDWQEPSWGVVGFSVLRSLRRRGDGRHRRREWRWRRSCRRLKRRKRGRRKRGRRKRGRRKRGRRKRGRRKRRRRKRRRR